MGIAFHGDFINSIGAASTRPKDSSKLPAVDSVI
jgi:hypothetical protein